MKLQPLPSISEYTPAQIEQAQKYSYSFSQYLNRKSSPALYHLRHQVWCEAFLATYFKTATTEQIAWHWSQLAEQILARIASELFPSQGVAIFAFGKLGSFELNLSSDVDLMIVGSEPNDQLNSLARQFQRKLSDLTDHGFLFRVDYELRPGGKAAPLTPSLDQVIDYYGNYGETWERMAFIRLRPIWGDPILTKKVMEFRPQFSFRKHLDFRLLEDLNVLRNKVQSFAQSKQRQGFLDLKLGMGGIRDIELFCHALQVIHGGRNNALHTGSTTQAFEEFSLHQILPPEDCQRLKDLYWRLRHLEHLAQGEGDQQTHYIGIHQLQHWNEGQILKEMEKASELVSGLLGQVQSQTARFPEELQEQKKWLLEIGFSSQEIDKSWESLPPIPALSRNKEKDSETRSTFLATILGKMVQKAKMPLRFSYLREFIQATRAKTSFYALLLRQPALLELIADVLCSSPLLSRMLCSRPEIIDSLVMRNIDGLELRSDWDQFLQSLVDLKQMTEFLAGADFLRTHDIEKLELSLSDLADEIVLRLWDKIQHEFSCQPVQIWALGKWGGRELGIQSDLDCIFVSEVEPTENELKALRRFINRLTESQRGGALYSIDTRLRTTEQTGILLTSKAQLEEHFAKGLLAWERQAYLKARPLSLNSEGLDSLNKIEFQSQLTAVEVAELNRIRLALLNNVVGRLDLKYQEGGLLDTELAVQTAMLELGPSQQGRSLAQMIAALESQKSDWKLYGAEILSNYRFMRVVEQSLRLISDETSPALSLEKDSFSRLADQLKMSTSELNAKLSAVLDAQARRLKLLDPRRAEK